MCLPISFGFSAVGPTVAKADFSAKQIGHYGVTDRTMRRWRERLEEQGYDGLADRRKGKPSFRRVPLQTCEEVLRLYQGKYFDLSIRHFHEKLQEEHGIELSYTWVQQALPGAGLVKKRKRRGPHRRRWERRPLSARHAAAH